MPTAIVPMLLVLLLACPARPATPAPAEGELDLRAAIDRALSRSPGLAAAEAAEVAGEARQSQARARLLPRVDFTESFTRSNNPVYVFGTLLTQGRFTEDNFAIDALNRPDPLSLYQSQLRLRQTLFDREVWLGLRQAELGVEMAMEAKRQAEMGVIFETVRSYFGVQVSARNLEVLEQAVETAEADLSRAEALEDAGQVTEADVLSVRVHLADRRQQAIRGRHTLELARVELNRAMGEPLDREFTLVSAFEPGAHIDVSRQDLEALERTALAKRPDTRRRALEVQVAEVGRKLARSSFLPSLALEAGWESDRVSFTGQGGTNWVVGLAVRIPLFEGLGRIGKLREAEADRRRARAERRDTEQEVRVEVRRATLHLEAAREQVEVARDAVSQARESHRIIQARYQAGLATLTELLRAENALLVSEANHLSALYENRLAEVELVLVTGSLHREAEVLKP